MSRIGNTEVSIEIYHEVGVDKKSIFLNQFAFALIQSI